MPYGHIWSDNGKIVGPVDGAGNTRSGWNSYMQSASNKAGVDAFDRYNYPFNEHDGHLHNEDGTKDFFDGTGKVGGVNSRS